MDGGNSQNLHAVVITGLKDSTSVDKVALALSRIIKNMSTDRIELRLSSLPWTLTSRITSENAARLVKFLDKAGATMKIEPPLETPGSVSVPQMQARPGTIAQSERPTFAPMEDIQAPERPRFQPRVASAGSPAPIEPGRKIAPLTGQRSASQDLAGPEQSGFLIEPLSLGGILDKTFQICRGYFWKLFAIEAVSGAAGAVFGIGTLIATSAFGLPAQVSGKAPPWQGLPTGLLLLAPIAFIALSVVQFLTHGALIYASSNICLGRDFEVREAFSLAWSRIRRLFFASMAVVCVFFGLFFVALFAGAFIWGMFRAMTSSGGWGAVLALPFWIALAFIPTYVFFRLMVVDTAVMVENLGVSEAFKRSWNLISGKAEGSWPRGYLTRIIVLFHLFILITIAIHVLVAGPEYVIGLILPKTVAQVLEQVLSSLGGVLAGMFNAVSGVIYYYDIRNRKEGFDLGMLAGSPKRD